MTSILERLKARAAALQIEVHTLYIASRDPRTPWLAKALLFIVLAYALSPLDLIPDFIPVFGILDDLIIVPAGIKLALKMIPSDVLENARQAATQNQIQIPALGKIGMTAIILVWILVAAWIIWRLYLL
ncbi:MAG TPA: YkvA family protein, partial [Anaerolineales bacterium]